MTARAGRKRRVPQPKRTARENDEVSLWARIVPLDGCWRWTGRLNEGGYGEVRWNGKRMRPHRVMYEILVGPIPAGLTIDHLCKHPDCVNPAHLEPVTMRENILRGGGAAAVCARATHCPYGHSLVENDGANGELGRRCLQCKRTRNRDHMRRKRASILGQPKARGRVRGGARFRDDGATTPEGSAG